jgi:hypothetical protein
MKNYLLLLLQLVFVIGFCYGIWYRVNELVALFSAAFMASVLIDYYIFLRNSNQL